MGRHSVTGKSPARVLVCDDERHILRLLQVNLERQGYRVDCATDGKEAIRLLEATLTAEGQVYEGVLLDAAMPIVDGYEVLVWIRSNPATKQLWVALMIPSHLLEEWKSRPHQADLYVTKPFNPTDVF